MAARTFLQLQDEALGDDFDATKYRVLTKRWLNDALWKIARRVRIPQLQSTSTIAVVAGTASYALPTDLVRLVSLRNTTDADPLTDIAINAVDDLPAARGKPTSFAVYGAQMLLYPTPDRVYPLELRYEKDSVEMSSDSDVPQLPDAYSDALVTYARARLFRAEDDLQASSTYMGEFNQALLDVRVELHGRDRARGRQIPGMFARGGGTPRFTRPGG